MLAPTLAEAVARGHGVERPFLCPIHGDSRPSASVNMIKQKWVCYTCGAHGSLSGEAALMEPDYFQMKMWLTNKLEEQRVYPEAWLSRWDAGPIHHYWIGRVGEAAARAFRLGYDAERDQVTYPLRRTDGAVLGVVRRSLDGSSPKYRYPRGIDIGGLLFNYRSVHSGSAVVLCEGAMDAIALWRVGVRAFAIYGARLSAAQVRLIDRLDPDHVYTAFDADEAGWRAHCATAKAFHHRMVHRITWPFSWGKDVDDLQRSGRLANLVSEVLEQQEITCIGSLTCGPLEQEQTQSSLISSTSTSPARRIQIVRTKN